MDRQILILVLLLVLSFDIRADNFDTTYVHSFHTNFTLKTNLTNRSFAFIIKPSNTPDSFESKGLRYSPNTNYFMGVGGTYRNVQVNLTFKVPNTEKDIDRYGKTTFQDLDLNLYMRSMGARCYYKKYSGFYLANPESNLKDWHNNQDYPQREDIDFQKTGVESFYVFNNKKYSLHATYKQTERQKRNVGSFLLKGAVNFTKLNAGNSLIPDQHYIYYSELEGLTRMKMKTVTISTGYTHSFIISKVFYITPIVFAGPSLQTNDYKVESGWEKNRYINFLSNIRLSSGYNGDAIFAGIIADWEGQMVHSKNVEVGSSNLFLRFNAGFRF